MRTVICAFDGREAQAVLRRHALNPREVIVATSPDRLRDLADVEVITTRRFRLRRDAFAIREALRVIRAAGRTGTHDAYASETP